MNWTFLFAPSYVSNGSQLSVPYLKCEASTRVGQRVINRVQMKADARMAALVPPPFDLLPCRWRGAVAEGDRGIWFLSALTTLALVRIP